MAYATIAVGSPVVGLYAATPARALADWIAAARSRTGSRAATSQCRLILRSAISRPNAAEASIVRTVPQARAPATCAAR